MGAIQSSKDKGIFIGSQKLYVDRRQSRLRPTSRRTDNSRDQPRSIIRPSKNSKKAPGKQVKLQDTKAKSKPSKDAKAKSNASKKKKNSKASKSHKVVIKQASDIG